MSDSCVFCTAPATRNTSLQVHLCRSSPNGPGLPTFLKLIQNLHVLVTFGRVPNPLPSRKTTSKLPEVVRDRQFLTLLTSKCASRHNGMHILNISTSKSATALKLFAQFDFEMCFAPQRRPLFWQLNFQKWSETVRFLHLTSKFSLRHNLVQFFNISTAKSAPDAFGFFTSKSASCHNGMQFFISHPTRWLRTRRFSAPTFRPSGAPKHWKHKVLRDVSTFSRTCIFFLLLFSSLTLPTSAFSCVHVVEV